jgi:hypothetical protein
MLNKLANFRDSFVCFCKQNMWDLIPLGSFVIVCVSIIVLVSMIPRPRCIGDVGGRVTINEETYEADKIVTSSNRVKWRDSKTGMWKEAGMTNVLIEYK